MFEGKAPFFARLISRTEFGNSERFFLTKMQVVGRNRTAASAANFQTGDHIAIFPKNHPDLVKKLIEKVLEVSEENRILRQRGQLEKRDKQKYPL